MHVDLKEVADIAQEIADLSMTIVPKLQRPVEDTSDFVRCLIEETGTVFTTIHQKVRTAEYILKTILPSCCSIPETPELERQIDTTSITEVPHSSGQESLIAVAPFSVKLPSTPPANNAHSRPNDLSLSTYMLPKAPVHNTSRPPHLPPYDGKVMVGNARKNDVNEQTPLDDDKGMARDDNKTDDVEHTSFQGNDWDWASVGSFLTSRMETTTLDPSDSDLLSRLTVQRQHAAYLQSSLINDSHLMLWMVEQHLTADADIDVIFKRLITELCEESMACVKRGMQHLDILEHGNIDGLFGVQQFIATVHEEVERARQSQCLPVRGNGPDTILCLDTSASMHGENFRKMIDVANQIIDGIERLANYEELQENVAVTTFGTDSRVALHLTNDYTQVRNVIEFLVAEGPSTLHEGLSMSIAACIGNYADVSVNDVRLMARVIVLTDGKLSAEHAEVGYDAFDPMNIITVPFAAKILKMNGHVCYCVQIGTRDDSEMLQILTQSTNGKIFLDAHVEELAMMSKHLFAATRLLHQFPDLVDGDVEARQNEVATLHALLDLESSSRGGFGREFSESEKETIIALAINISKRPSTKVAEPNEYLVQELDLELPPVGTRVRRGPDWNQTDNKDSYGPGTVVSHNNDESVDVLWDCGILPCTYRCSDPCHVLPTDSDERVVRDDELIQVGCKVMRGPDWTQGEDDGGPDSWGVVCMCTRKGNVTVRWLSRKIGKYRYGNEVVLLDTGQAQAAGNDSNIINIKFEPGNKSTLLSDTQYGEKSKPYKNVHFTTQYPGTDDCYAQFLTPDTPTCNVKPVLQDSLPVEVQPLTGPESSTPSVWSYLEEGEVKWTPFDARNNTRLEIDWSKRCKSSLVSANNKRYRVVFAKMAMSSIRVNNGESQLILNVKRKQKS